jgi:hypothetical protein
VPIYVLDDFERRDMIVALSRRNEHGFCVPATRMIFLGRNVEIRHCGHCRIDFLAGCEHVCEEAVTTLGRIELSNRDVGYGIACKHCGKSVAVTVAGDLVWRHRNDEEPTHAQASNFGWLVADALVSGPSRRARRREVERVEAEIWKRLRRELRSACERLDS